MIDALWTAAWQGSVFAVLVWGVTRYVKSPAVRSWLWWLVGLKFLLAPVVLFAPLVLPINPEPATAPPETTVAVRAPARSVHQAAHAGHLALALGEESSPVDWPAVLVAGWASGVGFVALKILRDQLVAVSWVRNGTPANDPRVATICIWIGLRRVPRVLYSADAPSPLACCPWRPTVLLPLGFTTDFDEKEQRAVLAHELGHILHRDLSLSLVPELACLCLYFVPFVWMAKRAWVTEREMLCDATALLAGGTTPRQYAALLLKFVDRPFRSRPVAVMGANPRFGELKMRIAQLNNGTRTNLASASAIVGSVALLLLPWAVGAQTGATDPKAIAAEMTTTVKRAKAVALAQLMYAQDYDGKMPLVESTPEDQLAVKPYMRVAGLVYDQVKAGKRNTDSEIAEFWKSLNPNGKRLLFNMKVSGLLTTIVNDPPDTIILFDDKPWPDKIRVVGFLDGHVKRTPESTFAEKIKAHWGP